MKLWMSYATLTLGLLCLGCGESGPPPTPTGTVTGKVTFNGEPVTEGSVNFYNNEKGTVASGQLGAGGAFTVDGAGLGANSVDVQPPSPPPFEGMEDGKEPPPPKEYPNIPEKYRTAATSGLTFEVKEGSSTFDIELQ